MTQRMFSAYGEASPLFVHHHHVASARECVQQSVHLGLDAGVWIPVNLIDVFGNVGRQPDRSAYR